ncbi:DotI/IcmL family type IV secretion protein [Legionella gresilensis]|uniref:DotI/IcmL family type IV secretion protein n=1 Tax=Legionella gresilensis TaxID=91823 RepID=UPI00104197E7|nr:DotI/IcmL family type IV secretion protein [Legionella gresilensis]
MYRFLKFVQTLLLLCPLITYADNTQLAVWANEAIVATYTYSFNNFIQRQREIARYFTAQGWTSYSDALNASKLPETVMKNNFFVSAVATMPPAVKSLNKNQWQATMPLLVVYKNPQFQQKQTLEVTIYFSQVPSNQGVRGLAINALQAKVIEPLCECQPPKKTDEQLPPNAPQ